ncbi:MAG: hypothetical protein KatS3mg061_0306 [Dehalococcoidia bacterium]|nr:MAG: hypothetical protein KatS3mg061_0306 [Dehalococcoidia bacterium]
MRRWLLWLQRERWLLALLALVGAFRLAALVSWRPGGYVVDWSERYFFAGWLRYVDAGYFPYRDFWMEYPPLLPLFGVVSYWLAQWLPPWRDPTLWFSLTTGLPLWLADLLTLALIGLIGRRLWGQPLALLAAAAWASLLLPLYFFLAGYDGPAVLALLFALWLALPSERGVRWRALLAGVALGLGFQYKVLPIAIAPAVVVAFWHQRRSAAGLCALALTLTVLLIVLPFLLLNPEMTIASYASILTRSSWETVYALLDGYVGGGMVAPLDRRFDALAAYQPQHPARFPWTLLSLAAGGLIALALARRHDWRKPLTVVTLATLSLLLVLLAAKGWSAQFVVYPLALLPLLWPDLRGMAYALLLSTVNLLEWPFWLAMLGEHGGILTALVLLRTALLLALVGECWMHVRPRGVPPVLRRLAAAAATALVVGVVVAMGWTYYHGRAEASPYRELRETLAAVGGTVVVTDPTLYRELRPYLGLRQRVVLIDPSGSSRQWAGLGEEPVALVFAGTPADREPHQRATQLLAGWLFPLGEQWLPNARILRFVPAGALEERPGARFSEGVTLLAVRVTPQSRPGAAAAVQLVWSTNRSLPEYSVFLHAYDSTGQLVAQHDGPPAAGSLPTSRWPLTTPVDDRRTLVLPGPGTYRLKAGLYDASGRRLLLLDGTDAADLGVVEVRA